MSEISIYTEKENKVWAFAAKEEFGSLDNILKHINDTNDMISRSISGTEAKERVLEVDGTHLKFILQLCVTGLAHNVGLAEERLKYALYNPPRLSSERLYQQSFVEVDYPNGPLAVVAYTAANSRQPEEWVVEGFLGDTLEPDVKTLSMDYPTTFGIDIADQDNLNRYMDHWWPKG